MFISKHNLVDKLLLKNLKNKKKQLYKIPKIKTEMMKYFLILTLFELLVLLLIRNS